MSLFLLLMASIILSIIVSSPTIELSNTYVLFNMFFGLKLNSPSKTLFVLLATASICLLIFFITVVLLFLLSLLRGWLGICLIKWTFSSKEANFLRLRWGWTGTCLIKVTSSLFFLFLLSWPSSSRACFLFLFNLSRGWRDTCLINLISSFVFLPNLSLGWAGVCFKKTTSSSIF